MCWVIFINKKSTKFSPLSFSLSRVYFFYFVILGIVSLSVFLLRILSLVTFTVSSLNEISAHFKFFQSPKKILLIFTKKVFNSFFQVQCILFILWFFESKKLFTLYEQKKKLFPTVKVRAITSVCKITMWFISSVRRSQSKKSFIFIFCCSFFSPRSERFFSMRLCSCHRQFLL